MVLTIIFKFQINKEINIHSNIKKKLYSKKFFKKPLIFFAISKFFYNNTKNYFKKIHHQPFIIQSSKLSSSSEIDKIVQEGEIIFKKNCTVGLPKVSRLNYSAIGKRQRDQRKHSFLDHKNTAQKRKWIHYEHSEISHHLMINN